MNSNKFRNTQPQKVKLMLKFEKSSVCPILLAEKAEAKYTCTK